MSLLFALATAASPGAVAGVDGSTYPRPTFTRDREFMILAPRAARTVYGDFPFQVTVFEHALSGCGLTTDEIRTRLEPLLAPESLVTRSLATLGQTWSGVRTLELRVLVDEFDASSEAPASDVFASYYLKKSQAVSERLIVLNCAPGSIDYWGPSLAHELTHAILDERELDSWTEEMIAQLIESYAGGDQPTVTAHRLASLPILPSFLQVRRPLPDSASYGMAYLLGRYLGERIGGPAFLQVVAGLTSRESPMPGESGYSSMIRRLRKHLQTFDAQDPRLEWLTEAGLIRYFAAAITLNSLAVPEYKIPGWVGLESIASGRLPTLHQAPSMMIPGQFLALAHATPLSAIHPALEAYRVFQWGGTFRILRDGEPKPPELVAVRPRDLKEYVLVIHTGSAPQTLRASP